MDILGLLEFSWHIYILSFLNFVIRDKKSLIGCFHGFGKSTIVQITYCFQGLLKVDYVVLLATIVRKTIVWHPYTKKAIA